jgi:co-chaperonin GroES (HSP10)
MKKMKSIKPINKYMLVSKVVEEMKSQSGLLYTSQESSDMRYQKAEVIAVGNLVDAIKEGDNVLYDKVYGHETIIEGVTYTVITEMNVVVVL